MTIDDTKRQFLAQIPAEVQAAAARPLDVLCGYFVAHLKLRDEMIDALITERDTARLQIQALKLEVQRTASEREHWYQALVQTQQLVVADEQRPRSLGLQPGEAAYEVERPAVPDEA